MTMSKSLTQSFALCAASALCSSRLSLDHVIDTQIIIKEQRRVLVSEDSIVDSFIVGSLLYTCFRLLGCCWRCVRRRHRLAEPFEHVVTPDRLH
jgi:hypothetical protein